MGATNENNPLLSFNFAIEVDGPVSVNGYFTECSGLGSEHELVENKITTEDGREIVQMIAGRLKFEPVTLKRGITGNMQIWDWRKMVEEGKMEEARANCSIVMFDRNYQEVARWNLERAWPSKVSGPSVKSDSNEIGVEEMQLAYEYQSRVS
jgi:phage tail-like protein